MKLKIWIIALTAFVLMLGVSLPLAADNVLTEDADTVKETATFSTDMEQWRESRRLSENSDRREGVLD